VRAELRHAHTRYRALYVDTGTPANDHEPKGLERGSRGGHGFESHRQLPYTNWYTNLGVIGRNAVIRCGHFSL
jgi:hypothetical protein